MQTEGTNRRKISKDPAGNRTRNLSYYISVPQPTVLLITSEKFTKRSIRECLYCSYLTKGKVVVYVGMFGN